MSTTIEGILLHLNGLRKYARTGRERQEYDLAIKRLKDTGAEIDAGLIRFSDEAPAQEATTAPKQQQEGRQ